MKRINANCRKIAALLLTMITGGFAFAQDNAASDTYENMPPQHDYVQYIAPGILVLLIIYVGYRYWHDNRPDDKINHNPHHQ